MTSNHQSASTARVIFLALVAGVVMFAAIAIYLVKTQGAFGNAEDLAGVLTITLGLQVVFALPAWFLVMNAFKKRMRGELPAMEAELEQGMIPQRVFTSSIFSAALFEGIGLFGVVTYLLTGETLVLLAPAIAVVLILLQIPSIERSRDLIQQLRRDA